MIRRKTRPQLKKLIAEQGTVKLFVGNVHNGIFWNGCYITNVSSMVDAEAALKYAQSHGWTGKLYFGIRE